jgi:molecular chaperone DnaK
MTRRKAVGIDLGTTFCAVGHIDMYGKPQVIPNTENERITPSVILFDARA